MTATRVPVNRTLVGVLALACLGSAAVIAMVDTWENGASAACLRVGLVLGAFWLALPTKSREAAWANLSPWTLVGCVGLALILYRWPLVFMGLIAMIVSASVLMKPKRRR